MYAVSGKKSKLNRLTVFDYVNITFMCLFCISIILPFWDLLQLSLTPSDKINTLELHLWPEHVT